MSDIWNEFEKIAVQQGLVSEDGLVSEAQNEQNEERTSPEPSKMPDRYDSLSDDAVRLLYNVEPETIFEKGKTIIEVAHPETAVAMRAYDAMNAVWENEHQRQDMMAYIALKQPNGHHIQKRYVAAKQDLVGSLTRAAFLLDNREEYGLMTLADSCTERLIEGEDEKKNFTKEAVDPLTIGIGVGVAALLGGAYYVLYGTTTATDVYRNSQQVLQALDSLNNQPYAAGIRKDVTNIMQMAQQVYALKNNLANIQSVDTAVKTVKDSKYQGLVEVTDTRIKNYVAQLHKVQAAIPGWIAKIKMVHNTSTEGQSDWWGKLRGLTDPFFWSADETLIDRLGGQKNWLGEGSTGGLYEAIGKDIQLMSQAIQAAQQQVQQNPESLFGPAPQTPAPQTPIPQVQPAPQPVAQAPVTVPASELPAPTPAPIPTPPSGSARKPPTGFGGLPQW